ncbi:MAG: shikimate kinase, partial [Desulfococcaceae bacterium]
MKTEQSNVVLIGMPGAGKSTIGVLLAKRLEYDFLDTDIVIQAREGRGLHRIIREEGTERFRALEARYVR